MMLVVNTYCLDASSPKWKKWLGRRAALIHSTIPQTLRKTSGEQEGKSRRTTSEMLPQDPRNTSHPCRSKTVFSIITFIKEGCTFILGIKFNNPTVLNLLMSLGYWLISWCSFWLICKSAVHILIFIKFGPELYQAILSLQHRQSNENIPICHKPDIKKRKKQHKNHGLHDSHETTKKIHP